MNKDEHNDTGRSLNTKIGKNLNCEASRKISDRVYLLFFTVPGFSSYRHILLSTKGISTDGPNL